MSVQISSIYSTNKFTAGQPSHVKIITYALILVGFLAVIYFGFGFFKNIAGLRGTAKLSADVYYGQAAVYLNDELLGTTPQQVDNVKPGENKIKLKGDGVEYEVSLNFLPNSEVVVIRDLGVSQSFSTGQNFWLEKSDNGTVLNIISSPVGANVYIDGINVGQTPYSSTQLTQGDYDLRIEYAGYESQTSRIEITPNHKLNVSTSLFPVPVPQRVDLLEGSATLYDVYTDNTVVTSELGLWASAVTYYNKTRGINIAGVGVNKEKVFDYFIDFSGNVYNPDGVKLDEKEIGSLTDVSAGAYLRRLSDGDGLSEKAKEALLVLGSAGGGIGGVKQVIILETGTGWLRVRSEPTLNGTEVARVDVGKSYVVLEETIEWVKVKVNDTVSGWVSGTYVKVN